MASPPEEQAEVSQVAGPNSMAVESSTRRSLPKETWLVDDYAAMPPPVEFMVCARVSLPKIDSISAEEGQLAFVYHYMMQTNEVVSRNEQKEASLLEENNQKLTEYEEDKRTHHDKLKDLNGELSELTKKVKEKEAQIDGIKSSLKDCKVLIDSCLGIQATHTSRLVMLQHVLRSRPSQPPSQPGSSQPGSTTVCDELFRMYGHYPNGEVLYYKALRTLCGLLENDPQFFCKQIRERVNGPSGPSLLEHLHTVGRRLGHRYFQDDILLPGYTLDWDVAKVTFAKRSGRIAYMLRYFGYKMYGVKCNEDKNANM